MTCGVSISHDGKAYAFVAERISVSDTVETWQVAAQGDKSRFITLINNRPAWHQRRQYNAFYKWTVIQGDAAYQRIVPLITNYLEYHIRGLWKPPTKGAQDARLQARKAQEKPFLQPRLFNRTIF